MTAVATTTAASAASLAVAARAIGVAATSAIASFGFTERQARLLVNVLLHLGVFVERQYCAYAGIVHGQRT